MCVTGDLQLWPNLVLLLKNRVAVVPQDRIRGKQGQVSHQEETSASSGESHTSSIVRGEKTNPWAATSNKGHHNDIFLLTLEAVHCGHLHP